MLKLNKMSFLVLAAAGLGSAHAATVNATTAGWNLLGYSDAADVVVADAFGDKTKVTTVWKWTGTGWAFYSPDLADGGQAYAGTKGYDFLTTIKSGDGFWVNAKTTFSATLPAAPAPANAAALTGITATMKAFSDLYATAMPTSTTALDPLVDTTFLMGGTNKADFLQAMLTTGNGPSVGATFVNITLVNPTDSGAAPNDATHQWFTFADSTGGGGPGSAWLATKNASDNWLMAGDQRQFDFSANVQAVKHISSSATASYNNQINVNVDKLPAAVTQVVLTGPGVNPASGLTIYSAGVGQIWPQNCNPGNTTNCVDPAAASAGSPYTVGAYGSASSSVPLYSYTSRLQNTPINPALLAGLSYPTITGISGSWAANTSLTINWSAGANTTGDWLNIGAWNQGTQLFSNVGTNISGTGASTTLNIPSYSGGYTGRNVWISVRDASGNRLALDYGL
ncbi:MAG: hypothetical protein PHH58_07875 [Rhodoferax sp.]|nr:hypothetical protein [Rhodoferax sp.]